MPNDRFSNFSVEKNDNNTMRRIIICFLTILIILIIPAVVFAAQYELSPSELPDAEAVEVLSEFDFKSISQNEIYGYINNFDVDAQTGNICITFNSSNAYNRAQWACVYDADGVFQYGIYTDWYRGINCAWIDGYMHLFPDVSNYVIRVENAGKTNTLFETNFDAFNSNGEKLSINGYTYELKKKNELSRDEYTSLERTDENGERSTLVSCTWISDDVILHSKVRSIFDIILQIGIPVFFITGITVWVILWKKKIRYRRFSNKRPESSDECSRL